MNIFITGISGFGGSHLTELLLRKDHRIYGFVRPEENLENISHVLDDVTLLYGDLLDEGSIFHAIEECHPDIVFHLAAEASAHKSFIVPIQFIDINVSGTVRLLESIRKSKATPRIVLVTSSEIYGLIQPEELPVDETAPFRPESPYAVTKVTVSFLAYQYYRNYGLAIIEARAFNHIGPRQALGFVVPDFCSQVAEIELDKRKAEISVGDLKDKRDFTDVRDVVEAYYLLAMKGEPGQAYNICSGESYKIEEILNKIINLSSRRITVVRDQQKVRPSKMPEMKGTHKKLVTKTGWQRKYSLDESIGDTFLYFKKRLSL